MLPGGESQTVLQEALAEETELSRERPRVPELSGQAQGEGQRERKPWGPAGPPPPPQAASREWCLRVCYKEQGQYGRFLNSNTEEKKMLGTGGAPQR